MTTLSRTVRVFLSSTFRDFAEERDLLVRKVFPELRRKCRERQVELVDVDLRWGITEKEAKQGKVLPICLAEIDRSRPYFIGFLGERYGWVPEKEKYDLSLLMEQPWLEEHRGGKSVTELEILHGVLNNPAMEGRTFFYFRDAKWSRKKGGAYLCEGTEEKDKLESLKDRIRQSGFQVLENYPSPEALAERVRADLWKLIDEAYPESEVPDALTRERMAHEAYGATRRRLYLGGEAYFKTLDEAMKAKAFRPVLITGQSGGGKSALVANWVARWCRKHPQTAVIVHHLGSGADAADPVRMAIRLMREIARLTGEEFKPESDPEKQMEQLLQWLALASSWAQRSKKELLIVLDGLDKVSDRKHLRWFPGFLPPKVKLVASCLHGEILEIAKGRLDWRELKVKPFIKTEQKAFIGEYLGRYRKALTGKQMKILQSHPLSGNPLFLLTVLEELRVFGVHEELEQRMQTLLSPPQSKGEDEAPTVDDVFEHVLARIEKDLGKKAVQQAMEAIWVSRAGLYQDELLAIARIPPAKWAAIRNALDESIYESSGKISFGHDYLRKAVEDRYFNTLPKKQKAHRKIGRFFFVQDNYLDTKHTTPNQRKATELPFQYLESGESGKLLKCLTDFDLLMAACHSGLFPQFFADYIRAAQVLAPNTTTIFSVWLRFLQQKAHVLNRADGKWPANRILLQLAWETGKNSPIAKAAANWIACGYCNWPRFQRAKQPAICQGNATVIRLEAVSHTIKGITETGSSKLLGWTNEELIEWDTITGRITKIWMDGKSRQLANCPTGGFHITSANAIASVDEIRLPSSEIQNTNIRSAIIINAHKAVALTEQNILLVWDRHTKKIILQIQLPLIGILELLASTENWIVVGERQKFDTDQGFDNKHKSVYALEVETQSLYEVVKMDHDNVLRIYERKSRGLYIIDRNQILIFDPAHSERYTDKMRRQLIGVHGVQCASENGLTNGEWLIVGTNKSIIWNAHKAKPSGFIDSIGSFCFKGCGEFFGNKVVLWDQDFDLEEGSFGHVTLFTKKTSIAWEKNQEGFLLGEESEAFDPFSSYEVALLDGEIAVCQEGAFWIFSPSSGTASAKYFDKRIQGVFWKLDDFILVKIKDERDGSISKTALRIEAIERNKANSLQVTEVHLAAIGYRIEYETVNKMPILRSNKGNFWYPFDSFPHQWDAGIPILPVLESPVSHGELGITIGAVYSKACCYVSVWNKGSEARWYGSGHLVQFVRHRSSIDDRLRYTPFIDGKFLFIDDSEEGFTQLQLIQQHVLC